MVTISSESEFNGLMNSLMKEFFQYTLRNLLTSRLLVHSKVIMVKFRIIVLA